VQQNVSRLQELWLGKIEPDFTIKKDRSIVEHDHGGIRAYERPGEQKPDKMQPSDKKPKGQQLTSIVVLCYQALTYTKQCITALLEHTRGDFEIVLVDNGSDDGTVSYLRQVAAEKTPCRLIENGENLGYAAGNNKGIAAARGEFIVLINNDVIVTDGWLDRLRHAAERDSKVGIVGPMTNRISGSQMLPEVGYDTETLAGLAEFAADLAKKKAHVAVPNWRAVGFCILIKRKVITKIGGLDERFGRGNFEDDDFCIRALLAGFETRLAADCFVHHHGSRSFAAAKVDYEQCLRENWEIFKAKWGIPAEVAYGASYDFTPHLQGGFDPAKHYCPLPAEAGGGKKQFAGSRAHPADEAAKLAEGEELFRAGRLLEADTAFREILATSPHHGRARNDLACVLWQQGASEEALNELSRILAHDPDDRDAAWNLGQFLYGLGRLNEAKQLYEAFVQRHPEDTEFATTLNMWRDHTAPQKTSRARSSHAIEPARTNQLLSSTNPEAR
jgi:GT2 family glycosyltransferase